MMIEKINVVTAMGANCYTVGRKCGTGEIDRIEKTPLPIDGDLYDHYCGFDKNNKMLFSVSCTAPCDIEYT